MSGFVSIADISELKLLRDSHARMPERLAEIQAVCARAYDQSREHADASMLSGEYPLALGCVWSIASQELARHPLQHANANELLQAFRRALYAEFGQ